MLKIPWKNLYTAPVVVLVERLHLLAVPSQGVAYNREKEDSIARDLRKQQLSRYERRQQLADSECPMAGKGQELGEWYEFEGEGIRWQEGNGGGEDRYCRSR